MTPHVSSVEDERTVNNAMRHQYRVLTEPEKAAVTAVKDAGQSMLTTLEQYCQPGRETSLARTRVEEAVMWAVRGITA
jgi:hypothetical protein